MSNMPGKEPELHDDPLLVALRHLPARPMDGTAEARLQRQARAAYVRELEGSSWHSSASGLFGRVAVPVFLAGVVGLYMTWAIAAATALVH
jgi:hypothetical protein